MHTLKQWLVIHPLTLALATFVIGCLVSVFSGDIRGFVLTRPEHFNTWLLKARITSSEAHLQQLIRLHASDRELFFYLSRAILWALMFLLAIAGIIFSEIADPTVRYLPLYLRIIFSNIVLAIGMSRAGMALVRIAELRHFDKSMAVLGATIQRLRTKLQLRGKMQP